MHQAANVLQYQCQYYLVRCCLHHLYGLTYAMTEILLVSENLCRRHPRPQVPHAMPEDLWWVITNSRKEIQEPRRKLPL